MAIVDDIGGTGSKEEIPAKTELNFTLLQISARRRLILGTSPGDYPLHFYFATICSLSLRDRLTATDR